MRRLLALIVTLCLVFAPGGQVMAASGTQSAPHHASAVAGHAGQTGSSASGHHGQALGASVGKTGGCHEPSARSTPDTVQKDCDHCSGKGKCAHQSCSCIKCFSAAAILKPADTGARLVVVRHEIAHVALPPGSVRQPPPPPPQL
ncbi:hypothetical protein [Rhodomicrobium sp.]|uniref:hypothetical protein n=1 Tax=Rhodomicrobium sp. TaxID=2720632 RepID=UPI0039E618BB